MTGSSPNRINELRQRARQLLGFDIGELAGATVNAEVPVPDALATRLITERMRAANLPVSDLELHALDGDALNVQFTIAGLALLPVVKLAIRIERQPQPHDPVLLLKWSLPGAGPLAMFAGPFMAKKLPAGIRMEGEHIAVDIRELAAQHGLVELLDYLTSLELHTRQGMLLLKVGIRVPGL